MSRRGAPSSLIQLIFVSIAALLAFTWAERTSRAESFAPPPMEFHPKPDSTVWILGSLELIGFGGHRLGALFASYGGEAHVWLTPNLGVGGRATAYGAGEPDGGASSGTIFSGSFSVRSKLVERTHQSVWLWGSIGGGSIGFAGYEESPNVGRFHERAAFVSGRLGAVGEYGPLAYGAAFEMIVAPGNGLAGAPIFFAGFAF